MVTTKPNASSSSNRPTFDVCRDGQFIGSIASTPNGDCWSAFAEYESGAYVIGLPSQRDAIAFLISQL